MSALGTLQTQNALTRIRLLTIVKVIFTIQDLIAKIFDQTDLVRGRVMSTSQIGWPISRSLYKARTLSLIKYTTALVILKV